MPSDEVVHSVKSYKVIQSVKLCVMFQNLYQCCVIGICVLPSAIDMLYHSGIRYSFFKQLIETGGEDSEYIKR